jgi:hypothetical protein
VPSHAKSFRGWVIMFFTGFLKNRHSLSNFSDEKICLLQAFFLLLLRHIFSSVPRKSSFPSSYIFWPISYFFFSSFRHDHKFCYFQTGGFLAPRCPDFLRSIQAEQSAQSPSLIPQKSKKRDWVLNSTEIY